MTVGGRRELFSRRSQSNVRPGGLLFARVTGDLADDEILRCAVDVGADVLATRDRQHLLPLGSYEGVRIVTAQALLAELAGAQP